MGENYQAVYDAVRSRFTFNPNDLISEFCGRNDMSMSIELVKQEFVSVALEMQRPSVVYRPALKQDGNQWCAMYGDCISDSVCAFGPSPRIAMEEFDKEWNKRME